MVLPLFGIISCAVFAAVVSAAHPVAISAAIESIESFYTDSDAITKDFVSEVFRLASADSRDAALKDIRSVEWTEEPSERRGQRLRSIVERYMTVRISEIEMELAGFEKDKKNGREAMRARLDGLRDALLERLEKVLKSESRDKKEIRPVPIIDRPPQETPAPGEEPGIWYR